MNHEILAADGVAAEIEHRILARYQGLQRVIQSTVDARGNGWMLTDLTKSAEVLAKALAGGLPAAEAVLSGMGLRAAGLIVEDLTDPHERASSAWWGTPLGRACGWWLGGPDPAGEVPTSTAAAIVGMTRQSVHEARARGRLTTAAAVCVHMQATYPLEPGFKLTPCGDPSPHPRHLKGALNCPGVRDG